MLQILPVLYAKVVYYVKDCGEINFYLFPISQWLQLLCSTNLGRHKDTYLNG